MFRAPRQLPPVAYLLDDLGSPEAAAKYLGVTTRTIARWRAGEQAPRPVMLALYWESRWGISQLHTDAHNAACQGQALAASYKRECERLAGVVARLETDHSWGSANSPVFNSA